MHKFASPFIGYFHSLLPPNAALSSSTPVLSQVANDTELPPLGEGRIASLVEEARRERRLV